MDSYDALRCRYVADGTRNGRRLSRPLRQACGTNMKLIGEQHESVRPPSTAATHPVAISPPVGRGQRTTTPAWMTMETGETAHAPGGLQQQQLPSIGARQEEDRAPAIVATRPVAALPPVGRGRWTITPAWMTRGSALKTGGLQELSGVQQGEGLPSMTAGTRLAVVPSPVGRGRRIATPA